MLSLVATSCELFITQYSNCCQQSPSVILLPVIIPEALCMTAQWWQLDEIQCMILCYILFQNQNQFPYGYNNMWALNILMIAKKNAQLLQNLKMTYKELAQINIFEWFHNCYFYAFNLMSYSICFSTQQPILSYSLLQQISSLVPRTTGIIFR